MEAPREYAASAPARAASKRNRGRKILFFRWYGFPRDCRLHLTQIGRHLRSIAGLRPRRDGR